MEIENGAKRQAAQRTHTAGKKCHIMDYKGIITSQHSKAHNTISLFPML